MRGGGRDAHTLRVSSDVALDVRGLTVRVGSIRILNDLTFHVMRGTSLAIIGPNGAGKTMLFRALIGAIPIEGRVRWAPGVRFGYVPQKLDLARDVPITGLDFLRAKTRVEQRVPDTIDEALAAVDLSRASARQSIGSLSGGQFQRLLVAFALVGWPDVLLLDEPTAGIDESGQERLNELMHRLQVERGLTLLLISHDLSIVFQYATNVLCLNRDRSCFGPPRTTLTQARLNDIYGAPLAFHVHQP
jgi:zinc transport system ATP-binding protein